MKTGCVPGRGQRLEAEARAAADAIAGDGPSRRVAIVIIAEGDDFGMFGGGQNTVDVAKALRLAASKLEGS